MKEAEAKLKLNSSSFMKEETALQYEKEASQFWDTFYSTHENKFFKDRHWLFTELPELSNEQQTENHTETEIITLGSEDSAARQDALTELGYSFSDLNFNPTKGSMPTASAAWSSSKTSAAVI
jgi:hypothetical protein